MHPEAVGSIRIIHAPHCFRQPGMGNHPPDVPHQPVNLSDTEPAQAIVVRNDPNEQEHVILYDPRAGSAEP